MPKCKANELRVLLTFRREDGSLRSYPGIMSVANFKRARAEAEKAGGSMTIIAIPDPLDSDPLDFEQ